MFMKKVFQPGNARFQNRWVTGGNSAVAMRRRQCRGAELKVTRLQLSRLNFPVQVGPYLLLRKPGKHKGKNPQAAETEKKEGSRGRNSAVFCSAQSPLAACVKTGSPRRKKGVALGVNRKHQTTTPGGPGPPRKGGKNRPPAPANRKVKGTAPGGKETAAPRQRMVPSSGLPLSGTASSNGDQRPKIFAEHAMRRGGQTSHSKGWDHRENSQLLCEQG